MEIQYRVTAENFAAFFEIAWGDGKAAKRKDYYGTMIWYLSVLAFASYFSFKHDEIFAVCLFLVLGANYLWQNTSFEQSWERQKRSYAELCDESLATAEISKEAIHEKSNGVETRIAWSRITSYAQTENEVIFFYKKQQALLIPLRDLLPWQREELITMARQQGVPERKTNGTAKS